MTEPTKFGRFARWFGADTTVQASAETFNRTGQALLTAVHMMPSEALYQFRTLLQQSKREEALAALEALPVTPDQRGILRGHIEGNRFADALEIITHQIAEGEGHLVRVAETANRLAPMILDPAVDRIGRNFAHVLIDRFCAAPHDLLSKAKRCVTALAEAVEAETDTNALRTRAAGYLQKLLAQAMRIFRQEPLSEEERQALTQMHTLLASDEPLTLHGLEEGLEVLTGRYESAAGVLPRLLDTAFGMGSKLVNETFEEFTPAIMKSESAAQPTPLTAVPRLLQGVTRDTTAHDLFVSDYRPLIADETALLSQNSAYLTMAQLVLNWIADIPVSPETIVGWIEQCNRERADFRSLVFARIDQSQCGFFSRLWAKTAYFVLSPLVHFYIKHFTHNFMAYILNLIGYNSRDGYGMALKGSITLLNEHVTDLNDAYNIVAGRDPSKGPPGQPPMTGTIPQRLERELAYPAYREGMTLPQFYAALSSSFVDRFAPTFNLSERFSELLEQVRFSEESYLRWFNPLLAVSTTFFSYLFKALLFVPETAFNYAAGFLMKWGMNKTGVMEQLLTSTEHAMGLGEEYAHAIHLFFLKKLKEAWGLMNAQEGASIDFIELQKAIPEGTKEELRSLFSTFFVVLEKQKAGNQNLDKLRRMVDANQPLQFLQDLGDRLIMEEANAMETAVDYLSGLLRFLFQERQLLEVVHHGLATMNEQAFTLSHRPSQEEMRAVESEMLHFLDKILNKAIRDAVTEKLHPLQSYQREANLFVDEMRHSIQEFLSSITSYLSEGSFDQLLKCWQAVKVARADALINTEGNRSVNEDSRTKLNALSLELAARLDAMKEPISVLAEHFSLCKIREFVPRLIEDQYFEQNGANETLLHLSSVFVDGLKAFEHSSLLQPLALQLRSSSAPVQSALHQLISASDALATLEMFAASLSSEQPLQPELFEIDTLPLATRTELAQLARARTLSIAHLQALTETYRASLDQAKNLLRQAGQAIQIRLPPSNRQTTPEQGAFQLHTHLHELLLWKNGVLYIECEDTSPIPFARLSDPLISIVCKQIKQRTDMIPKFLTTRYNWRGFVSRFGLAFLRDGG